MSADAKVIPLWQSRHDLLMRLRYPPNGDVDEWVRLGGRSAAVNSFVGRDIAQHTHRAGSPGADCRMCGFPWWPESNTEASS